MLFKKKGLQDPRDCELAETFQSTEVFLLLLNTASYMQPASQPAGQLTEQSELLKEVRYTLSVAINNSKHI